MHQTSYFVSDLHLFCSRFAGPRCWNKLLEVSKCATTVVLGGDIFDFRWTTHPTIEYSVHVAVQMLACLVRGNRQCQFHYVLGNHDHHHEFLGRSPRFYPLLAAICLLGVVFCWAIPLNYVYVFYAVVLFPEVVRVAFTGVRKEVVGARPQ